VIAPLVDRDPPAAVEDLDHSRRGAQVDLLTDQV